jgi:hypothetical protein
MGESDVALDPVPLAGCDTLKATAQVSGSYTATLNMHATLSDGTVFATADAGCFNPPHE